jgi:hypothetical protein
MVGMHREERSITLPMLSYNGPVRFTFLFGTSEVRNYLMTVSLRGTLQTRVDVTVSA